MEPAQLLIAIILAALIASPLPLLLQRFGRGYAALATVLVMAACLALLAPLVPAAMDGVVLVVREGRSRREGIRLFMETIGPEKIIGVVFNAYRSNLLERRLSGAYGSDYYSSYGLENR